MSSPCSTRLLVLLPLASTALVLSACGSPARPGSSAVTTGSTASPAPSAAATVPPVDALAVVRESGTSAESAGTASYTYRQTATVPGHPPVELLTRTGTLDVAHGRHEVHEEFAAEPGTGATHLSLTFLASTGQVLMDDPSITVKTGKRWTVVPATGFSDLATPDVSLPMARVLRQAVGPAVRTGVVPGGVEYDVHIAEYDAIGLLSGTAELQLEQEAGLTTDAVRQQFDGLVELAVTTDPQDRLLSVQGDLTAVLAHVSAVRRHRGATPTLTLTYQVHDLGAPVSIDVPAADTIGAWPG